MNRLLFLAAIVAVVYILLNSYRHRASGGKSPEKAEYPPRGEDMVRCVHCGVHLPKSESILAGGKYYCSDAHLRAHQSPPSNRDAG